MQLTADEEMTDLIRACLPSLDEIEAAFVQDCWLGEPRVPLKELSEKWHLSAKALTELRSRVMLQMKELLSKQRIQSMADLV